MLKENFVYIMQINAYTDYIKIKNAYCNKVEATAEVDSIKPQMVRSTLQVGCTLKTAKNQLVNMLYPKYF